MVVLLAFASLFAPPLLSVPHHGPSWPRCQNVSLSLFNGLLTLLDGLAQEMRVGYRLIKRCTNESANSAIIIALCSDSEQVLSDLPK